MGLADLIKLSLIFGSGYTFQSSQYGPAIDNVASYELVLPNGTVTTVLPGDDLFFALRGAFNNYGIVTKFTFVTHPQVLDQRYYLSRKLTSIFRPTSTEV